MPAVRVDHSAVLLGNGKLLVAGGNVDLARELIVFDPQTRSWSSAGWLEFPVSSAVVLGNGKVLLAGNAHYIETASARTWLFDPMSGAVQAGPDMVTARSHAAAAMLSDGKVLVAGGASTAELYDPAQNSFVATGAPAVGDTLYALARLKSGKVLAVGRTAADVFDPAADGGKGAFVPTAAPIASGSGAVRKAAVVALPDGRALMTGGCPFGCVLGDPTAFGVQSAQVFDPAASGGVGAFTAISPMTKGRFGHTATVLPSGNVLIAGGDGTTELFVAATQTFQSGPNMSASRVGGAATLLPTGEVLLIGGTNALEMQDRADVFVEPGKNTAGPDLNHGRDLPSLTLLRSGKVLVAGGTTTDGGGGYVAEAELLDVATNTSTATGIMGLARIRHTASALPDGTVLLAGGTGAGGDTATTEIYDPSTGAFSAGPTMEQPRSSHVAVSLRDGNVLLAGGAAGLELFDAQTKQLKSLGSITPSAASAVQLRSGEILLLDLHSAYLLDLSSLAVKPTSGFEGGGENVALSVLPDGSVLAFTTIGTLAQRYVPDLGTWVTTGPYHKPWVTRSPLFVLPGGNAFSAGGTQEVMGTQSAVSTQQLFSRISELGKGAFFQAGSLLTARMNPSACLLSDGGVLVAGNQFPTPTTDLWSLPMDASRRPEISQAPPKLVPGTVQSLAGSRFLALGPSTSPQIAWMAENGNGYESGEVLSFTDTSLQFRFRASANRGQGRLHVMVDGMASTGALAELAPAGAGVACTSATDCMSGFCADGVCCDTACQNACMACAVARKGTGTDGTCEPIPPGFSTTDGCAVWLGGACSSAADCTTLLCADGVCCDQPCTGQCEACSVMGSVGHCVPVLGAPVGARPACGVDQQGQACTQRACDATNRTSCQGFVGKEQSCRVAACSAGLATFAASCDGKGSCPAPETKKCEPYVCDGDKCGDAPCESDAQCGLKFRCAIASGAKKGDCVARTDLVCQGDHLVKAPDGSVKDCSPYRCDLEGCRTNCTTSTDCIQGAVCDPSQANGVCVPIEGPAPADEAGCGCTVPGQSRTVRGWMVAVLLLGLAWSRDRRRARSSDARAPRAIAAESDVARRMV